MSTAQRRCIVCALAAVLAGGCALQPLPKQSEVLSQSLPETTHIAPQWQAKANPGAVPAHWLGDFKDPPLEAIVAEAMAHNTDLRAVAAQVQAAQQAVTVVGARMLPAVGAKLGARTLDDHDNSRSNSTLGYAGVAWEIDVWGRLRAQRDAADFSAQAAAQDYVYARESLAALVAKSWYLCIETRQLLALSEQAVVVYGDLAKLVKVRRTAGKDSDLNVAEVSARLDSARSAVEAARQDYGEARRALEILLGRYPAAEIETASAFTPLPPPSGAGLPSELLERRADVVAAERQVLAAFRQREAAQLSLLPSFSLSLTAGRLGDQLLSLLQRNPWLTTADVGMSIPIYQGGALKAQVAIASAQQAMAVANYGSVVLTALREVEDALASEHLLAKQLPSDERALAARDESVRIATVQYLAGRNDLLWVAQLQAQQLVQQASLIRLEGAQRANRIRLYQALGGGFNDVPDVAAVLPVTY